MLVPPAMPTLRPWWPGSPGTCACCVSRQRHPVSTPTSPGLCLLVSSRQRWVPGYNCFRPVGTLSAVTICGKQSGRHTPTGRHCSPYLSLWVCIELELWKCQLVDPVGWAGAGVLRMCTCDLLAEAGGSPGIPAPTLGKRESRADLTEDAVPRQCAKDVGSQMGYLHIPGSWGWAVLRPGHKRAGESTAEGTSACLVATGFPRLNSRR